jgi:hypothetical protein
MSVAEQSAQLRAQSDFTVKAGATDCGITTADNTMSSEVRAIKLDKSLLST